MFVKKNHVYDGSKNVGKPVGNTLKVKQIVDHKPVDGPTRKNTVAILEDGTWEFVWNLTVIKEDKERVFKINDIIIVEGGYCHNNKYKIINFVIEEKSYVILINIETLKRYGEPIEVNNIYYITEDMLRIKWLEKEKETRFEKIN